MIAQIGKLNEDCVKISGSYLLYFLRNKPSKSDTVGSGQVGPGQFIILNYSASPKMVIKIYFNLFRFLKVLEVFECSRGDPYTTANRNFVHSYRRGIGNIFIGSIFSGRWNL